MRALILVDLQYDFMPGGALAVSEGDQTVAVANKLLPRFPLAVATQDAHPPDHGSFVSQHAGASVYDQIDLHGLPQTVWPVHCVPGTRGAELHQDLDRSRIARVFPKGTDRRLDSYSGFFDNGKRASTGMGEYLKERGVTEVFVLGLATDYCVKFTALDAVALGFKTHLVVDGCRAVNIGPHDGQKAIEAMKEAGIEVVQSNDLMY